MAGEGRSPRAAEPEASIDTPPGLIYTHVTGYMTLSRWFMAQDPASDAHRRGPRGSGRATIHDVATAAGVSVATVSRFLNGTGRVSPEVSARLRDAIARLEFVANPLARSLSLNRTSTLGLLFPEISGPFFAQSLRGIEAAAGAAGYNLLIYARSAQAAGQPASIPIGRRNADGLLIMSDAVPDDYLRALHAAGVPLVLVYRSIADLVLPAVTVENRGGVRRLVGHLVGLGRRRIALITGPRDNQDSQERERGYHEGLAEHGLAFDPALVVAGNFSEETGAAGARELLARFPDMRKPPGKGRKQPAFTAIVAGDDETAIGAIAALRAAGLRVPEDVAVVGFDDIAPSRYVQPALTTARAPTEQVGREAVRLLLDAIAGAPAPAEPLRLPVELVVRASCGSR
jgi:LacI family transcriptional regulator